MTTLPWTPPPEALHQHPELGHLALLSHHLRVLTELFTLLHSGGDAEDPLLHQARGIVQVTRVLQHQIEAYRQLRVVPKTPAPKSFVRGGPQRT
jgi:flagellar biosynthesis/type III secretory pathway ATPase